MSKKLGKIAEKRSLMTGGTSNREQNSARPPDSANKDLRIGENPMEREKKTKTKRADHLQRKNKTKLN
jgi:hypothetical protein